MGQAINKATKGRNKKAFRCDASSTQPYVTAHTLACVTIAIDRHISGMPCMMLVLLYSVVVLPCSLRAVLTHAVPHWNSRRVPPYPGQELIQTYEKKDRDRSSSDEKPATVNEQHEWPLPAPSNPDSKRRLSKTFGSRCGWVGVCTTAVVVGAVRCDALGQVTFQDCVSVVCKHAALPLLSLGLYFFLSFLPLHVSVPFDLLSLPHAVEL